MTQQVKVPESIMYGIIGPDGKPYFDEFCVSGRCGDLAAEVLGLNEHSGEGLYREAGLITTDQAEAYKDACVREALEEEITLSSMYGATIEPDAAIRALIKKE